MREVNTPIFIPLRAKCQDTQRPTGNDGSSGFTVPTLRGIWDTFPLLVSGSAGLGAFGAEPGFNPGCAPGSAGCCAELQSPLNPGGIPKERISFYESRRCFMASWRFIGVLAVSSFR